MNGRRAKTLRGRAGFNPNAPREYDQHEAGKIFFTVLNGKGEQEVMSLPTFTWRLPPGDARLHYKRLKREARHV